MTLTVHAAPAPAEDPPAPVPLKGDTLSALPAGITVPSYDRRALRPGVVHIGVGGFHRAHQALYFDDLAAAGLGEEWGIVGVGLHDPAMGHVLSAQDCLWMVVQRGRTETARVVGVMADYLHAASQCEEVLEVLSTRSTRIVTLTITGDGYNLDQSGRFRAHDASVAADLAHPEAPDTAFGYLVEALRRRRREGVAPFTVLSCDNVPRNGAAAREMVVAYARLRDPELAEWIDRRVSFPNSVVDRITPETTPDDRSHIVDSCGVDDRWPVVTEQFSQWVIEDDFCNGRPPLERVGVQFVADVSPFELAKKRLLNGSHCAIGCLGTLAGHCTTAEVMTEPLFAAFIDRMTDEIIPLLPPTDGLDLARYKDTIVERLSNPHMSDRLTRLCRRGSTKVPSYLLPSYLEAVERGRPHRMLTLAVAGWLHYLHGIDDAGRPIHVDDPLSCDLTHLAQQCDSNCGKLLHAHAVFGPLAANPDVVAELTKAVLLLAKGTRAALRTYLSSVVVGSQR